MSKFVKDLLERAAKTFLYTFSATMVIPAVSSIYSVDAWKAAAVSAAAAAISATGSVLSKGIGNPDSASVVE